MYLTEKNNIKSKQTQNKPKPNVVYSFVSETSDALIVPDFH